MEGLKQRMLGLCLPPLLLCVLDSTLTLLGQPPQYWAGEYTHVNELSPTFAHLLQVHPLAFIAGGAVWVVVFVGAILLLPGTAALIVSIAVTLGHTIGSTTWFFRWLGYGYQLSNGLVLVSAVLVGVGIRWGWRAVPQFECHVGKPPLLVRSGMIGVLLGLGSYLYLWPRSNASSEQQESIVEFAEAIASTDHELAQLTNASELKALYLSGAEITETGLRHLERLPKLQYLTLRGLRLTDTGCEYIKTLTSLRGLNLYDVAIDNAGLEALEGLTHIADLNLCGPHVTDSWLQHVRAMSQLRSLYIINSPVTDAGLEHLKGMPHLQELYIHGTLVSNAGLRNITGLPQLRSLVLAQIKITDSGLEYLAGMPQLREVFFSGTNCTSKGRHRLQQALPKCKVR